MKDNNSNPKLLVSKAEASENIREQIDKGKELYTVQISSELEYNNLCHEREKWVDFNQDLCKSLFDNSPLSSSHGYSLGFARILNNTLLEQNIEALKKDIGSAVNELESIDKRLDLYEETIPNTLQHTANNDNNKIFIGHGGSHIWRELKDFIVDTLELEYEEFNRISPAGKATSDRLKEMLEVSRIAFLIMTGEDEQADGSLRARENVIHEVGLFQGKLGFERAIILLEKGCGDFSNIHGITYIPFPKGNIKAAFEDIRQVLERESIM